MHVEGQCMSAPICSWLIFSCVTMHRSSGPVDVEHFKSVLVESACEHSAEKLLSSWFPRVTSMFSGAHCKAPSPFKTRNNHFYKCVDILMRNQVQGLLTSTILSYMQLVEEEDGEGEGGLPQFKLNLCLDGSSMEFFPSLGELEATVLSPVEAVATALSEVCCIKVSLCHSPHVIIGDRMWGMCIVCVCG